VDCALALIARGRQVKTVCSVLGVARSNVGERAKRPANWSDGRKSRRPLDDAGVVAEIWAEVRRMRLQASQPRHVPVDIGPHVNVIGDGTAGEPFARSAGTSHLRRMQQHEDFRGLAAPRPLHEVAVLGLVQHGWSSGIGEQAVEIRLCQARKHRVADRYDGGRARRTRVQAHLADDLATSHLAHSVRRPVFVGHVSAQPAADHNEHRIAGFALGHQRPAAGDLDPFESVVKLADRVRIEVAEESAQVSDEQLVLMKIWHWRPPSPRAQRTSTCHADRAARVAGTGETIPRQKRNPTPTIGPPNDIDDTGRSPRKS
jgi:hypothetical protein